MEQTLCYCVAVPRPRIHDPDRVLDAVETLATGGGPNAVTVRAVAARAGLSNGALYHSFRSRGELLGRAWLRAGTRFLDVQQELVDAAVPGVEAVVAAAAAPAVFAERHRGSARLVLTVRRDEILAPGLPEDLVRELSGLDRLLVQLMIRLAEAVWGRTDGAAVDTITTCIVDLPTAILLDRERLANPTAREHLRAAVRAVLAVGPAPTRRKGKNP